MTPSSLRTTSSVATVAEALLAGGGALVGALIMWLVGARTRLQLVEARIRLARTEHRLQETQILLAGTLADLADATKALNVQSAMQAAGGALNARVL